MDQKIRIKILLTVVPLGISLLIGCRDSPPLQQVNSLGKITVGQFLPNYAGSSESGKVMGNKPARGKFLIHLLHPELPPTCVDDECGEVGVLVKNQGGQLYGGSDRKLAGAVFDILPPPNSSKTIDEYGVLVVSDLEGKVLAIYNHASPASVRISLSNLQTRQPSSS